MTELAQTILQQALTLSPLDRSVLIEALVASLSQAAPSLDAPWAKTNDNQTAAAIDRPIWEIAQEITQDMTEAEIRQLPSDGAEQHDHYIYGTPKRSA
jgi:hypothetical protein